MLSKETACRFFSPVRYHTSQPVAQPANITVSPHPGFSHGASRVSGAGGGDVNTGKKCSLAGDSEQQAYLHFRICLDVLPCLQDEALASTCLQKRDSPSTRVYSEIELAKSAGKGPRD